jgi:hypothetical protein
MEENFNWWMPVAYLITRFSVIKINVSRMLSSLQTELSFQKLAINRIGGIMVSVIASSAVDRGFEPRSSQTRDYGIGMCCFSVMHAALMIMYPSEAT